MSFIQMEKKMMSLVAEMGCLFLQLFLVVQHESLCCSKWTDTDLYYARKKPIPRTIKTVFGKVKYWRTYLVRKDNIGCGFHPLDSVLVLTRDGFSPFIMSLVTRLATRVSFGSTAKIFYYFYGWSPSTDSIEKLVLGLGREAGAYMENIKTLEGDGEVLVIECDGKATPTATDEELKNEEVNEKIERRPAASVTGGKKNVKNLIAGVVKKVIKVKTVEV